MTRLISSEKHCAGEYVAEGDFWREMFLNIPRPGLNLSGTERLPAYEPVRELCYLPGPACQIHTFCLITCSARPLWREIGQVQDKHKSTHPWAGHKQAGCFLLIKRKCQQREKPLDFLFTVKSGDAKLHNLLFGHSLLKPRGRRVKNGRKGRSE